MRLPFRTAAILVLTLAAASGIGHAQQSTGVKSSTPTAPADPALEDYVWLKRALALNERCRWIPGASLEYLALANSRDERLAWLTATGKLLTANLATNNITQLVANVPCTGTEADAMRQQIGSVAWQMGVQWMLRAYLLQSPQFPPRPLDKMVAGADERDPQGRPQWFHGLSIDMGNAGKLGEAVLGLKNPARQSPQAIAWIEQQQKQALVDAERWGRLFCKPWKGGITYSGGSCPAVPAEDEKFRDYAQLWAQKARDMAMRVSYPSGETQAPAPGAAAAASPTASPASIANAAAHEVLTDAVTRICVPAVENKKALAGLAEALGMTPVPTEAGSWAIETRNGQLKANLRTPESCTLAFKAKGGNADLAHYRQITMHFLEWGKQQQPAFQVQTSFTEFSTFSRRHADGDTDQISVNDIGPKKGDIVVTYTHKRATGAAR